MAASEKPCDLYFGEILHGPSEIMSDMEKREEELMRENVKLRREVEGGKICHSARSILKLESPAIALQLRSPVIYLSYQNKP